MLKLSKTIYLFWLKMRVEVFATIRKCPIVHFGLKSFFVSSYSSTSSPSDLRLVEVNENTIHLGTEMNFTGNFFLLIFHSCMCAIVCALFHEQTFNKERESSERNELNGEKINWKIEKWNQEKKSSILFRYFAPKNTHNTQTNCAVWWTHFSFTLVRYFAFERLFFRRNISFRFVVFFDHAINIKIGVCVSKS